MKKIKHIVYLMLENRSFDNVLGWLYDEQNPPKVNIPAQTPPTFDGLKDNTYFNLDADGNRHYVTKGTGNNMSVPMHDPHEEYEYVNDQLFGAMENPPDGTPAKMEGFYKDFATYGSHPEQIMQTYTPEELPVLNGLARAFAVSDRYFCSVPTQTNCNRAFSHCGNSLGVNKDGKLEGWVNNRDFDLNPVGGHLSQPEGRQFNQKTFWNVLTENNFDSTSDWMQYHSCGSWFEDFLGVEGYSYTRDLMEQLQGDESTSHFADIDEFFSRAQAGTLPKVCFLEPDWGLKKLLLGHDWGINGNDYHPPTNLAPGEEFVKSVYDALTSNKEAWDQTLFIINFDEHGGTYDHVPPPWGAAVPWSNDDCPAPHTTEYSFQFNRFGVRVPLILVSPLVQAGTVFRAEGDTPYDHTSVIATILTLMGVPKDRWQLGARTANAPTFENVLTLTTPRRDIPVVETNASGFEGPIDNTQLNDIQARGLQSAHAAVAARIGTTAELEVHKIIDDVKDMAEATEAVGHEIVNKIKRLL